MKTNWWKVLCVVTLAQLGFTVAIALGFEASAIPTTDAEAFNLGNSLWSFFVTKNYAAMAGPVLTLLVWALKKYDSVIFNALKLPKVAAAVNTFLDKPFVSFLLPTVIAGAAGGVTAVATGHSATDALNAAWQTSSTAIATYVGLKKIGEQMGQGAPPAAPPGPPILEAVPKP